MSHKFTKKRKIEYLFSGVSTALLISISTITEIIALSSIIFSGPLEEGFATGIQILLTSAILAAFLVPIFSSYKLIFAGPRPAQIIIFSTLAVSITSAMQDSPTSAQLATTIWAMLIATFLVGFSMFTFGIVKLGKLVRYIPYSVIAGFFSGLGLLIIYAGIEASLLPLSHAHPKIISIEFLFNVGPAFIIALLIFIINRFLNFKFLVPLSFLLLLFIINLIFLGTGVDIKDLSIINFTNIESHHFSFFHFLNPEVFQNVNWIVIAKQSGSIVLLVIVSIIMLLIETSSIEVAANREIDPNHELRGTGFANMLAAPFGAITFGPTAAETIHAVEMSESRTLYRYFFCFMILAVMYSGISFLDFIPGFLLGAFLIFIGTSHVLEWTWNARHRLPRIEVVGIFVIALTLAFYGILISIFIGMAIAILLFVMNYSKLPFLKSSLKGLEFSGNVDRSNSEQDILDQNGNQIRILVLQGFLFFGTAYRLFEEAKKSMDTASSNRIQFLIIDFERVEAIDSSAVSSIIKLLQLCKRFHVSPFFSGCDSDIHNSLDNMIHEYKHYELAAVQFFFNIELAHEECCEKILLQHPNIHSEKYESVDNFFETLFPTSMVNLISKRIDKIYLKQNDILFRQGDIGDALYWVASGLISIQLRTESNRIRVLRKIRAGALFGEMAIYTDGLRSAEAMALKDTTLFKMTKENLLILEQEVPNFAKDFHRLTIRLMSDRVSRLNREVVALRR